MGTAPRTEPFTFNRHIVQPAGRAFSLFAGILLVQGLPMAPFFLPMHTPDRREPTHRPRILFVCMGNICRSPAAENVFRTMAEDAGVDPSLCDSAGTIDLHHGKRPDKRMIEAARRRRLHLLGTARQIRPEDFDHFDLIVVMDVENAADVRSLAQTRPTAAEDVQKIRMFCDFCENNDDWEVPDPYYGGEAGFEYVLDLLEDGCRSLVRQVKSGKLQEGAG